MDLWVDADCRHVLHRAVLDVQKGGPYGPVGPAPPLHRRLVGHRAGLRDGCGVGLAVHVRRRWASWPVPGRPGALKHGRERDHAARISARCGLSAPGRLEGAVAECDTPDMRLFEHVPPGVVLLCVIAGVGTLLWGLLFAAPFSVGAGALALGHYLDNYGLESGDS